jgi:hypothetical protein
MGSGLNIQQLRRCAPGSLQFSVTASAIFLPPRCLAHRPVVQPALGVVDFPHALLLGAAAAGRGPHFSQQFGGPDRRIVECLDLTRMAVS